MNVARRVDLALAAITLASLGAGWIGSGSALAVALSIGAIAIAPGRAVLRWLAPKMGGSLGCAIALAISPVIAGVVVTILMLVGAPCAIAAAAMLLASAIALAWAGIRGPRDESETPDVPQLGLPAIGLALVATAFVAYPLVASNRVRTSIHGMLHSAILFEALDGGVPPANPFFAGEPLRYYWTWHLAVAAPVELAGADPTIVFAAGNVAACLAFALLLGHLAVFLAARTFGAAGPRVGALGVALGLLSLNPLGALFFSKQADELGAKFSSLEQLAAGDDVIRYLQALALGKDDRITATLTKFFNVSSFPIALALLAASWLFAARTIERPDRGNVVLLLIATAGGIALSPLTGLTGGLAIGLAVTLALIPALRDAPTRNHLLATAGTLLLAVLAAIPFVLFSGGDDSGSVRLGASLAKLLEHSLALGPAIAVALFAVIAASSRNHAGRVLALAGLLLLPLGVLLKFPVNSEYKLVREAAPLLGVFAAVSLDRLLARKSIATTLLATLVVLAFVPTNAIAWNAYRASARAELPFRFTAGYFELDRNAHPIAEIHEWIRLHTAADAVLLDDHDTVRHFAGPFHGAEAPALAQRAVFCDRPSYMNDFEPDLPARRATQESIYAGRKLAPDDVRRLDAFGSRLYAIVRADSPRYDVSLRGITLSLRFEKVFECEAGKVYRWKAR